MTDRRSFGVIRRVLEQMERQHVSYQQLAARLPGWTEQMLALRLGELMPLRAGQQAGGRVPLTGSEIRQLAEALKVPVRELTSDRPASAKAA
jgi:hypothetical protein